jgi:hypothetical protein
MEMREKHIMVLERVMENAPEQAQPALNSVIERSKERLNIEDEVVDDGTGEEEGNENEEEVEIGEVEDNDKEKVDNPNKLDEEEETSIGQKISDFVKSLGNKGRDVEEDDAIDDLDEEESEEDEEVDETEED